MVGDGTRFLLAKRLQGVLYRSLPLPGAVAGRCYFATVSGIFSAPNLRLTLLESMEISCYSAMRQLSWSAGFVIISCGARGSIAAIRRATRSPLLMHDLLVGRCNYPRVNEGKRMRIETRKVV